MNETQCPCCEGVLRPWFHCVIDPDTLQSFAIDRCETCGLGRTLPIPDNLDEFYQQEYHGGRHGVTTRLCDRRRVGIVDRLMGSAKGRRLLDVGCGDGTFMATVKWLGWSTVGTETHPQRSRARGLQVFQSLDEASALGPYDCVTMWHSLEHFSDANQAFAAITELLCDVGEFVIAVPNFESWQAKLFGRHWVHLDVPRHLSHFSMRSIEHFAARHQLRATRLRQSEFEYDLMGWIQSGLNAIGLPQNWLLKAMMGREAGESAVIRLVCFALGFLIGAVAFLPTVIGCLTGHGGTLVVSLRHAESE